MIDISGNQRNESSVQVIYAWSFVCLDKDLFQIAGVWLYISGM